MEVPEIGERVTILVNEVEFNVNGNTLWVQSPLGGTVLRIKCSGKINVEKCQDNPVSHTDILVAGDINICLSDDFCNLSK